MIAQGRSSPVFGQALMKSRQAEARVAYNEAEKRNVELREIEKSLVDLVALMNDVSDFSLKGLKCKVSVKV